MGAKVGVALLIGWIATVAQAAGPKITEREVQFQKGSNSATLKGRLKGDEIVDYKLRASAGQTLTVAFEPGNPSAYFNVLPPGSDAAIFIGSTSGNRYQGGLTDDGTYTIRVYLMRNAARRNESASYTLDVEVSGAAQKAAARPKG